MSSQFMTRLSCAVALCAGLSSLAQAQSVETIASGLNNPRGIAFAPNGELYVAEMGNGGPGPCIPSPAAPVPRCYGESGAITRIESHSDTGFTRVVTGLPSLALPNGTAEGGTADLSFHGMVAHVTIGLGGDPSVVRAALPEKGRMFGTLLKVRPSGRYSVFADVSIHEANNNPYGGAIDSNPYGVLALPGRTLVADAGANAIIEIRADGSTHTLVTLAPVQPNNRDPVPTSVFEGPDGGLYASQLTGFPFFRGTSTVLRMEPDGSWVEPYAEGFTAALDLTIDCHSGALYVLETATGHVGPFPPNPGLGAGRLVRQCPGGAREVLLDNLVFPGGVAIGPDGNVYLTNFGTSPTAGQVLKLTVPACN